MDGKTDRKKRQTDKTQFSIHSTGLSPIWYAAQKEEEIVPKKSGYGQTNQPTSWPTNGETFL